MSKNLLILGGTTEATALCTHLAGTDLRATLSFAGRVERPRRQPLPQRIGGFGGAVGLADYIKNETITHVIDATHPFAAQMSNNAVTACAQTGTPLIALTRAPWEPMSGDNWIQVADMTSAATKLATLPGQNIMLAVGRMHLGEFAGLDQHSYLLRLVDPPQTPPPFARFHAEISRGPFTHADDLTLMQRHNITVVVSKNAGGTGAYSKISAARELGAQVIMIDRPEIAPRPEVHSVPAVMDWLNAHPA